MITWTSRRDAAAPRRNNGIGWRTGGRDQHNRVFIGPNWVSTP